MFVHWQRFAISQLEQGRRKSLWYRRSTTEVEEFGADQQHKYVRQAPILNCVHFQYCLIVCGNSGKQNSWLFQVRSEKRTEFCSLPFQPSLLGVPFSVPLCTTQIASDSWQPMDDKSKVIGDHVSSSLTIRTDFHQESNSQLLTQVGKPPISQ